MFLTAADTARVLGISAGTLAAMRCQGRGPAYVKVGRLVKYDPADVRAYVEGLPRHRPGDSA